MLFRSAEFAANFKIAFFTSSRPHQTLSPYFFQPAVHINFVGRPGLSLGTQIITGKDGGRDPYGDPPLLEAASSASGA